jgi:hypothetical protein
MLSAIDNIIIIMANPFFSGRIPTDLHKRIEQYISETGVSKTQVLINALATYLDFPISTQNLAPASQVSKEIFSALEERVKILEELIRASTATQNSVIKLDNTDNASNSELEITPSIKSEQLDNKPDNNKTNNDNKQLEISNVISSENKNNEAIILEVLTTYGPVSESNMAKWSKRDRGILQRHRQVLEANGSPTDTPLPTEVNGKLYHLKCVGEGKKHGNRIVKEWVAELIDNMDNVDNNVVVTHPKNSDSLSLP